MPETYAFGESTDPARSTPVGIPESGIVVPAERERNVEPSSRVDKSDEKALNRENLDAKALEPVKSIPKDVARVKEGKQTVARVGRKAIKMQGSLKSVNNRVVRSRKRDSAVTLTRASTRMLEQRKSAKSIKFQADRRIETEHKQLNSRAKATDNRKQIERVNLLRRIPRDPLSSELQRKRALLSSRETAILVSKSSMPPRSLPRALVRPITQVVTRVSRKLESRALNTKLDILRMELIRRKLNSAILRLKPEIRDPIRKIVEQSPPRMRVRILQGLRDERRNLSRQLKDPIQTEGKRVRQVLKRIPNTIEPDIRKFIAVYIVNQLGFYRNARDLIRLAREMNKKWAKKLKQLDLEKILASGAEVLVDEKIKKKVKKNGEKKYSRVNHSAEKLSSSSNRAVTLTADGAVPKLELDIVTMKEENSLGAVES